MAKNLDFGVEQDMTPMIDIVFLLIIFFMVVTELTLNQAEVILPVAPEAVVEEPQPGERVLTINVSLANQDGSDEPIELIQINADAPVADVKELTQALKAEVAAYGKMIPKPNKPGESDSAIQVIIRCDRNAKSGNFHKIFKACTDAKIFKVSLAAQNERLGNPYEPE